MTEFSKPPNSYKYFDYANKFLSRLWEIFNLSIVSDHSNQTNMF